MAKSTHSFPLGVIREEQLKVDIFWSRMRITNIITKDAPSKTHSNKHKPELGLFHTQTRS